MSENALRNAFIFGTLFFFVVLGGLTVDSLQEVSSVRTPQLTDQVVAGKGVWQAKNCNDCHTILGIGGYFAPELTKVVERRGVDWIGSWLKDPKAVDPIATMPNQRLGEAQVADLVAFFQWVGEIDTNQWPPEPVMAAGAGPSGEELFAEKGCSGCHMINGEGTAGPGPDLSHIATQPYDNLPNDRASLFNWLEDPQAQKPGTTHPQVPLTEPELDALVEYLSGLK